MLRAEQNLNEESGMAVLPHRLRHLYFLAAGSHFRLTLPICNLQDVTLIRVRGEKRDHTLGLCSNQSLRNGLAKTNRLPTEETILLFSSCFTDLVMLPVFMTPVSTMKAFE